MIKQKIFNFNFNLNDNNSNFFVNSTNKNAFDGITSQNLKGIFLVGPNKSGKSSLADIWLNKFNGIKFNNNFEQIINNYKNVLIDDIDRKNNEENLFHILNHCKLNNLRILITSKYQIKDMQLGLNDLISRIKTFNFFEIYKPDDEMLINLLTKLFVEKQFVINSNDIFKYILNNAERSYENVFNIVNKLDKLSLEKKRQLTIPLIKEIL